MGSHRELLSDSISKMPDRESLPTTTNYRTLAEETSQTLFDIQHDQTHESSKYILAANLYSCQGKQQEAISILEQGLRAIASSNDNNSSTQSSSRQLIKQQIDVIKARLERRIDFISRCPLEIVCTIASHLDTKTTMQCLDVCRSWRAKFLKYRSAWKSLSLIGSSGKKQKPVQILSVMSEYIETISILARPEQIRRHFRLLKANTFRNLRSLSISGTGEPVTVDLNLTKSLFKDVLPCVSNTLTRLELISNSFIKISLIRLLSTCPKLTHLKVNVYSLANTADSTTTTDSSLLNEIPESTALTYLSVTTHWPMLSGVLGILHPLFPHLAHLRRLIILYHSMNRLNRRVDVFDVLGEESCPELEYVVSGFSDVARKRNNMVGDDGDSLFFDVPADDGDDDDDDDELYDDGAAPTIESTANTTADGRKDIVSVPEGTKQQVKGLRRLVIHGLRSAIPLRSRLEKSSNTLRTMSISFNFSSHFLNISSWEPLSTFTMYKLTSLHVSKRCDMFYLHLPTILLRFPALESLCLDDGSVSMSQQQLGFTLVDAIIQLTRLSTLQLRRFYMVPCRNLYDRLMLHFALMVQEEPEEASSSLASATGDSCHSSCRGLKCLRIVDCAGFGASAFQQAAKIKSLRKLSIVLSSQDQQQVSADDVNAFAQSIGELAFLSELGLGKMTLQDESALAVSACKTLERLALKEILGLTRKGAKLLEDRMEVTFFV